MPQVGTKLLCLEEKKRSVLSYLCVCVCVCLVTCFVMRGRQKGVDLSVGGGRKDLRGVGGEKA